MTETDPRLQRDPKRFAQSIQDTHRLSLLTSPYAVPEAQWEVFTDISKYQGCYDETYPERIMAFRGDSGYSTDTHAATNLQVARRRITEGKTRVVVVYVVHVPGNNDSVFARTKALIGAPFSRLVVEIDEESTADFAGPGDHSASANQLAGYFAGWLGNWRKVWPYANAYDRRSNWPTMDPRLVFENRASWGTHDPGTYAQQYAGGISTPVPAGLPTSVVPFGHDVDINVIRRSIDQIELDLGITAPKPTPKPKPPKPVVAHNHTGDIMDLVAPAKTDYPKGGKGWPGWHTWNGCQLVHILTEDTLHALHAAGHPYVEIRKADFDAWPKA